jgi:hypothetical protein
MAARVSLFPPGQVTAVLLVGRTDWLPISRMSESLVRISDKRGSAGLPGFRIECTDGTVLGVAATAIAGVQVGGTHV